MIRPPQFTLTFCPENRIIKWVVLVSDCKENVVDEKTIGRFPSIHIGSLQHFTCPPLQADITESVFHDCNRKRGRKMKSHSSSNVTLWLVGLAAVVPLLTAAGCAPLESPYVWAYEYEAAEAQKRADAEVVQAKTLVEQGEYDQAINLLNSTIKQYPNTSNAYYWRGRAYYGKQAHQEALNDLNQHLQKQPSDNFGFNLRGNLHETMGNLNEAIADYDRAIQIRPSAFYYFRRAQLHQSKGNSDKAVADLTSAMNDPLTEDMVRFHGWNWKADVLWTRGSIHSKNGNLEAARADGLEAIEFNPKRKLAFNKDNILDYFDGDKRAKVGSESLAAAQDTEAEGNFITAFQQYQRAHAWDAEDSDTTGKAIAGMQRLYSKLQVKPKIAEDVRRFAVQAEAASSNQKYDEAIDLYNRAIGAAPWWPQGHYNLAMLMAEKNDFKGAIEKMKLYLQLTPEAQDARVAQDKIYEWEYKLKSPSAN